METWKITELQTIAQAIVDDAKESGEGSFTYDSRKAYLECTYTADYTDVKYYPESGYEGGDLCRLELYIIDACWYDEDENETDFTEKEEQMLQDEVNELIY